MTSDEKDLIAIIGMGCRFPGGATSPAAFWRLLRDGVDAITDVPPDRWNLRPVYDPDRAAPGTMCTRWGGFVEQIDRFDAQFFGIAPREASRIDPQQRLLLEVAWEALEDAGLPPESLAGTNTGVFIGITTHDYYDIQLSPTDRQGINAYTNLGGHLSIAANRVSYVFDFHGPSMAIDTACSSSLVAVHLACQSLLQDECPLALAGGVNVLLKPEITIGFSQAAMLSPDGRCRSFDARANGYVRSEGAGLIVLKSLARAVADRDPIYAVIRGSAVNEDGRTRGITVPSLQAQEALLRAACDRAGVSPEQVQYVEAHGTGTPAGDPVEAVALGTVFGKPRPPGDDCMIGSVKTNLGHLEPAAGVAGLMKVALMLTHQQIPPHLHFETPHPDIPFEALRLRIPRSLETWPAPRRRPRLAGVSSFGFGGANAHVIVEEAPPPSDSRDEASAPGRACILPLSARSQTALQARVRADLEFLKETASTPQVSLRDVCSSASLRRGHHDYRLAVVAHSREELVEHLEAYVRGETRATISSGHRTPGQPPRLVFVFTGMGPQWWGMGRQLLDEEPVFRDAVEQCDAVFQQYAGWSVLKELTAEESLSRIAETQVAQPANFALQIGLAALWRSWGIVPDGIVGHSVGEIAVAYMAGALGLEDAVQVVYHRSRLQQRTAGHGTMAAVGFSAEAAERVVRDYEGRVSIAAFNSPSAVTLSGETEALNEIVRSLTSRGIFCRFLQVEVPYHSPQMEPLQDELLESLRCLQPRPSTIPLFSTVTGQRVDGAELDAAYWWRNVRAPVRFAAAIDALIQAGSPLLLEIGPHPVLAASIQECLAAAGKDGTVLYTLRRQEPERATMLGSVGALYALGYPIDWKQLYPNGGRFVRFPSYPWQRERHWQESEASRQARLGDPTPSARSVPGTPVHPLLGARLQSAWPVWDTQLDTPRLAYLADHRVQGAAVYPAAAYVEMALAAGRDALDGHTGSVEEVEFHRPLFLTGEPPPALQLVFDPASSSFEVYSQAQHEHSSWVRHVTGKLFRLDHRHAPEPVGLDAIRQRCRDEVSGHACYQRFQQTGLHYGPCFQAIEHLSRGHDEALARVQVPEQLQPGIEDYILHPALLDACFQTLLAASSVDTMSLPVWIERIRVYHPPGLRAWAYACVGKQTERTLAGDIQLCDETGRVLADVQGMRCQALMETEESTEDRDSILYEYRWEQDEARPVASFRPGQTGRWLIFADRAGVGQQLADRLSACHQSVLLFSPGDTYHPVDSSHVQIPLNRRDAMQSLLKEVLDGQPNCRGVIYLWGLDAPPPEQTTVASLDPAQPFGCLCLLHLVQWLAYVDWSTPPRLWLVTRGVHAVDGQEPPVSVAQSPVWGLSRVIINEHPELHCTMVDLSPASSPEEVQSLFDELWTDDQEDEIALRSSSRYVHRLVQAPLTTIQTRAQIRNPQSAIRNLHESFHLTLSTPGLLDTLVLRACPRRSSGPGEVEIQVYAAGLNFKDVAKAMHLLAGASLEGTFSGHALGLECAGVITAIGDGVEGMHVGDDVIAYAPDCFSRYAVTDARLVMQKPPHLSFEDAVTIPVAFLTAYYALHHLGRMTQGERVLIHAAAGGVGLAAVQLAQRAGAEVFATAGSDEKREFLRSLGVRHAMDSRSLAFADEVMALTDGKGVDLVLNSLAGEAIPKSLSVLGPYGRFIELGKRDIDQDRKVGLRPFHNNLSFFAVDLDRLLRERPDAARALFQAVMRRIEDGTMSPLPHQVFPISDVISAFRYMAQARHIGKVVVSVRDQEVLVSPAEGLLPTTDYRPPTTDGTYLITGGLGGFGLAVARWLVAQGARHLALIGRRGASTTAAQEAVDALRAAGVEVVVAKADVTQAQQVAGVLADIARSMPPLRGIVHAAMVLDDDLLIHLNHDLLRRVMAPKVLGAWNLHTQTLDAPLDFFVLFSSMASTVGSPGQGGYAAANAFLDTLAHYRAALGLPVLTVNWGYIDDVGVVAQQTGLREYLQRMGWKGLPSARALNILTGLLQRGAVHVAVAPMDWEQWTQKHAAGASPRFSRVSEDSQKTDQPDMALRDALLAACPSHRRSMLEAHLCDQVACVLGASASQIAVDQPFADLGLDSLMAVELMNRLKTSLGVRLPAVLIWRYPTIAELAAFLGHEMHQEG